MVINGEIISKLLKTKSFKNPKDVADLMACCEAFPESTIPFILLNNFQADIFKSHLWQKSEEFIAENLENCQHFKGQSTESGTKTKKTVPKDIDYKNLICAFLENFIAKKIDFQKKLNFFVLNLEIQKEEEIKESLEVDSKNSNDSTHNEKIIGNQTKIEF